MSLDHVSIHDAGQYVKDVAAFLPFVVQELGGKNVTGAATVSLEMDGDTKTQKLLLAFERRMPPQTMELAITKLLSKIPDSKLAREDFRVESGEMAVGIKF